MEFIPLKILAVGGEDDPQAEAVRKAAGEKAQFFFLKEFDAEVFSKIKPDLVLITSGVLHEEMRFIEEARHQNIPSLALQDGILEWRCQYENPLFGSGGGPPQHQPVMADKIGCLGHQSARQMAAWGNAAKVEVTGMPRLDRILQSQTWRPPARPGKTLLVMTAQKPWFDDKQRNLVLQSLRDLKEFLSSKPEIQVLWRLTRDIPGILGVENHETDKGEAGLIRLIESADAVITTPSTAAIESMMLSRPVAFLDYTNSPRFFPAVWQISAKSHLSTAVADLLNPGAAKMAYQNDILNDVLQNTEPSASRVFDLILKMVEEFRDQLRKRQSVALPPAMLDSTPIFVSYLPLLAALYPGHQIFSEANPTRLQSRLAAAVKENEMLKRRLRSRSLGYWMELLGNYWVREFRSKRGNEA